MYAGFVTDLRKIDLDLNVDKRLMYSTIYLIFNRGEYHMRKALLVVTITILACLQLHAQDQRVFSQFFMNPYIYNPAYAGVDGHSVFYALYRQQYAGLDGAPQLSHINFHTPLRNNLAVGALAFNESEGPLTTSGAKFTAGYFFEVDKNHYLRFGLSLGGGYSYFDQSKFDSGNDVAFQDLPNSSFVTADFGVTYHFDQFNVGLSLPNLLGREAIAGEAFAAVSVNPLHNMMIKANYRGHVAHNIAIEPHILYRFSTENMPQFEIATVVHLMHVAWAGLGYRQDAGAVGLIGFKVKETFGIGIAYEIGNSDINSVTGGTTEIHIGYHIPKKKKHHSHSHSFFKSHQQTKRQKELAALRRQQLIAKRKQLAEQTSSQTNNPETKTSGNQQNTGKVDEQAQSDVAKADEAKKVVSEKVDESVPVQERTTTAGVKEIGRTVVVTLADGTTKQEVRWEPAPVTQDEVAESKPEETVEKKPQAKPEMVNENTARRGHHFLELPVGHHVVAAQFKDFQEAEDYSDTLFERGFHGTIVGYVSAVGEYFVVVHAGATPEQAAEEQLKWRKLRDLDHVYIFNIVE